MVRTSLVVWALVAVAAGAHGSATGLTPYGSAVKGPVAAAAVPAADADPSTPWGALGYALLPGQEDVGPSLGGPVLVDGTGRVLVLEVLDGACVATRVRTGRHDGDEVHLVLRDVPGALHGGCGAMGIPAEVTVTLREPLGDRRIVLDRPASIWSA